MTPEAKEKKKVKDYLNSLWETYHFWPVPSGYGRQGIDCYACIRGQFFGLEVKASGSKPTKRQELTLQQINGAKGIAIAGTGDEICSAIRKLTR